MYTSINFKTKKMLKEAVSSGLQVSVYQPGGIFHPKEESSTYSGTAFVEGPHYPAPHTWYAKVKIENGIIVEVK